VPTTGRLDVFHLDDPMTRLQIPASTWHERVAHWRGTGLSAEAYCRDHDIGVERLKYWARRVERAAGSPQLLPMRIGVPSCAPALELRSPSGWSMRMDTGVDAAWLARLLQELR